MLLNASLSADIICGSSLFLLELSTMKIPVLKNEMMTLDTYLDEESSSLVELCNGVPAWELVE